MKKFTLAVVIFFLVLSTAIIKNTTKQIEDELIQKNINHIKIYNISDDINKIQNYKIINE